MYNVPRTFTRQVYRHKRLRRFTSLSKIVIYTISDTLNFNETLFEQKNRFYTISDTLTFSESLGRQDSLHLTVYDTISFTENIVENKSSVINVHDTINFTQTLSESSSHRIGQQLHFTETINVSKRGSVAVHKHYLCPEDYLTFTENIVVSKQHFKKFLLYDIVYFVECTDYDDTHYTNVQYLSISDTLAFNEHISNAFGQILSETISDTLTFTQQLTSTKGNVYSRIISDTLTFTETITKQKQIYRTIYDNISFNTVINNHRYVTKRFKQQLIFGENISINKVSNLNLNETLVFLDYVPRVLNGQITIQQPNIIYTVVHDVCPC